MAVDQDQYRKIFAIFMEEAEEHLAVFESGLKNLPAIMANPDREEAIAMYRAAHSIKGGAAMLMGEVPSLSSINQVAKRLEDCFKPVKDNPFRVDATAQTLSTKAYEVLRNLTERCQSPPGLSEAMGDKIVTASLPLFDKLEKYLQALATGKVPTAPATSSQTVPRAAAQVMLVLKPMLQSFKGSDSPTRRKQLAGLCARLTQVGKGIEPWQNLVKTAHKAIIQPQNSLGDLANTVIKELKQGSELLEAGRAREIGPGEKLLQLASGKVAASEVMLPTDPREAVKVLIKTFDKRQLQAIAQLLVKHVKSA
ncbi:MAG: histidine kinase [Oscillatoriales cyanobacterium RM2_1_1]|nr:histidine kinase [Oscillatoriales cyanobacterium SM2_3_0]NJO47395.1 histidine kinase [Oscillatoriales cyanobacterium RM2_1_1]